MRDGLLGEGGSIALLPSIARPIQSIYERFQREGSNLEPKQQTMILDKALLLLNSSTHKGEGKKGRGCCSRKCRNASVMKWAARVLDSSFRIFMHLIWACHHQGDGLGGRAWASVMRVHSWNERVMIGHMMYASYNFWLPPVTSPVESR